MDSLSSTDSTGRKRPGSTLKNARIQRRSLSPLDFSSEAVIGGVESDEAVSSEDDAQDESSDGEETDTLSMATVVNGPDLNEGDSSDEYISESTPQRKKRKAIAPEDAALSAAKRLKYDGQMVGSSLPPRPPPASQSKAPLTREELEKMLTDAESDEASATEADSADEDGQDEEEQLSKPRPLTTLMFGGSASDNEKSSGDDSDDGTYPEPDAAGRRTRAVTKARRAARMAAGGA